VQRNARERDDVAVGLESPDFASPEDDADG
jgi:hypothetical protein